MKKQIIFGLILGAFLFTFILLNISNVSAGYTIYNSCKPADLPNQNAFCQDLCNMLGDCRSGVSNCNEGSDWMCILTACEGGCSSGCMFNPRVALPHPYWSEQNPGWECRTKRCSGGDLYCYDACGRIKNKYQDCANGCSNNACISCTSHTSSQCYSGDVYWYDSCGNREEIKNDCGDDSYSSWQNICQNGNLYSQRTFYDRGCSSGCSLSTSTQEELVQTCANGCDNGACITCQSNYTSQCYNNDVYWYDSCGDLGDLREDCANGCTNDTCIICEDNFTSHCYNNELFWYDSCGEIGSMRENCLFGCSNDLCINCQSQSTFQCHNGDSYWYDSCGNIENLREDCQYECFNGYCLNENNQTITDVFWANSQNQTITSAFTGDIVYLIANGFNLNESVIFSIYRNALFFQNLTGPYTSIIFNQTGTYYFIGSLDGDGMQSGNLTISVEDEDDGGDGDGNGANDEEDDEDENNIKDLDDETYFDYSNDGNEIFYGNTESIQLNGNAEKVNVGLFLGISAFNWLLILLIIAIIIILIAIIYLIL